MGTQLAYWRRVLQDTGKRWSSFSIGKFALATGTLIAMYLLTSAGFSWFAPGIDSGQRTIVALGVALILTFILMLLATPARLHAASAAELALVAAERDGLRARLQSIESAKPRFGNLYVKREDPYPETTVFYLVIENAGEQSAAFTAEILSISLQEWPGWPGGHHFGHWSNCETVARHIAPGASGMLRLVEVVSDQSMNDCAQVRFLTHVGSDVERVFDEHWFEDFKGPGRPRYTVELRIYCEPPAANGVQSVVVQFDGLKVEVRPSGT